jgi:hypothetical protein
VQQRPSTDYRELLIRWFQFGTFCPIFRIHGFRSETEMWKYGPEAEKILPHNIAFPVDLIEVNSGEPPSELIAGRIALILNEP